MHDKTKTVELPVKHQIGMVGPPAWFNFCADEFCSLAPGQIAVMTSQLRFDTDFGYTLPEIRSAAGEVETAVKSLGESDTECIAQIGTPFSTAHGWRGGCELEARLTKASGVATEMMGLSIVRAFKALGLSSATVSTVYYDEEWTKQYVNFLTESGIEVQYAGSFADHGAHGPVSILDTRHHTFDTETLVQSVKGVCERAPRADAVIISGIPCRMLELVPKLEALAGRPVINYVALYSRLLRRLGLPLPTDAGSVFMAPADT